MKYNSGFPLPTIINPGVYRYVCVPIPDDPGHRQAFAGSMFNLAKWYSWEGDEARTGKLAAAIWYPIFLDVMQQLDQGLVGCGVQGVRQNPEDLCELQYSDDGSTWITFATISLCEHDHPEYVAINPNSITRNIITPTADYPNLILQAISGQTANLLNLVGASASIAFSSNAQILTSGIHDWRNGGASLLNFQAVAGASGFARFARHANYRNVSILTTDPNQKLLIGDSSATATARTQIKNFLATLPILDLQMAASQTAYALRILNNAGTLISGFDELGRLANVTGSGKPTDLIVRGGVQRVDTALKEIWVKGSNSGTDDWWKVGQKLENVTVNMLPAGDPASGSISGDTITVNVPETEIPPAPTPANYWFLGRQDRPLPGESVEFELVVMADGYTMFPCTLEDGDIIEIVALRGWWDDTNFDPTSTATRPTGYNANGSLFSDPTSFTTLASDPYTSEPHMCPLLEYQLEDGSYTGLQLNQGYVITVALLNDLSPYGRLFANKELFEGAGGIQIKCLFTADDYDWCYLFDFLSVDGGFSASEQEPGSGFCTSWISGQGWKNNGTINSFGYYDATIQIILDLGSSAINRISWGSAGQGVVSPDTNWQILDSLGDVIAQSFPPSVEGNGDHVIEGLNVTGDDLVFKIWANGQQNTTRLTYVKLEGDGSNPIGSDNC